MDIVLQNDKARLKEKGPYICSYWKEICVKNGCLCLDEKIAIPKAIKDAVLEDIHSTHPGSFAVLSLAQNIWWPSTHRDIPAKASVCKSCTDIGKSFKPVIPHSNWSPLNKCTKPNEEFQIDFGGRMLNEKEIEKHFLVSIDRYSKNLTTETVNIAASPNVIKLINTHTHI